MIQPPTDLASRQREQRVVLGIGLIVAALPIAIQILMALALAVDSSAFPVADRTLLDARFWPTQIVLLCVAVAGNAAVDFIRVMRRGNPTTAYALTLFLLLLVFFICISVMFSVSLLNSRIGWLWLAGMAAFGLVDLFFAYLLQIELATCK